MAKTLATLRGQKPSWIRIDEPVSGSTNPAAQDATVLPDGTVIHNVEGVNNRTPAQLWGLIQLLADIYDVGHEEDGSHQLVDADIAPGAAIAEAKLSLDFVGTARPSGGNYAGTADLVAEIDYWSPYYLTAQRLANTNPSLLNRISATSAKANGFDGRPLLAVAGPQNAVLVAQDETLWRAAFAYHLRGSLSAGTDCYVDVGAPSALAAEGLGHRTCVWLEFVQHDVIASGFAFPYGNAQYGNVNQIAGTNGLPFAHTDAAVTVGDPQFVTMLADPAHNLYVGASGNLYQSVYLLRSAHVDYDMYPMGVDDPSVLSLDGTPFVVDTRNAGQYVSVGGDSAAQPVAIVQRRNLGVYHRTINPAGCARLRTGAAAVTGFSDCFQTTRVGYFSATGVECPDYAPAGYSASTDTFVVAATTYHRSGLSITTVTGRFDGLFADIVVANDAEAIKPRSVRPFRIANEAANRLFAGKLRTKLTPVYYGTVLSMHASEFYQKSPTQLVGLGTSEAVVFGANNLGGVFIDRTNNNQTGYADGVRYMWSDREQVQRVALSFVQGNDNSENYPQMLTYESTSGTVTLNTTALTGAPLVTGVAPIMRWANGDAVVLSVGWTGLGTTSAAATVSPADSSAHSGQQCFMEASIVYAKGSGLPFLTNDVVRVQTQAGDLLAFTQLSALVTNFTFTGTTNLAPTTSVVVLTSGASAANGHYVGQQLTVLNSLDASVAVGTVRTITAYDGATRTATLDTPLTATLKAGDTVSISPVAAGGQGTVVFDGYSRAILGAVRRAYATAGADGVVGLGKPIVSATAGTIHGTVIVGLAPNQVVDVLFYEDTPFKTPLYVWLRNNTNHTSFTPVPSIGKCEIIDPGYVFVTNIGSANQGTKAYMGVIPGVHYPHVDNVKWVGTASVVDNLVSNLGLAVNLAWEGIAPFSGMMLDYGTLLPDVDFEGSPVAIQSLSEVAAPNAGLVAVATLVRDAGGYKLLVALTQDGNISYTNRNKLYLVDLNKLVGDTHE